MGSSFLCVAITGYNGSVRRELVAGLERAKAITKPDELPDYYYEQHVGEEGPWDDDDQDVIDEFMRDVREMLVDAFNTVISDYDDDNAQSFHFETGNREIMVTGGSSWGDSPSEVFDAMCRVLDSDLYYGDRLSKESRALKERVLANGKKLSKSAQSRIEQDLDDCIHQLQSEVASSINNEGWEAQVEHLFEDYEDTVTQLFEEFLGKDLLKKLMAS